MTGIDWAAAGVVAAVLAAFAVDVVAARWRWRAECDRLEALLDAGCDVSVLPGGAVLHHAGCGCGHPDGIGGAR